MLIKPHFKRTFLRVQVVCAHHGHQVNAPPSMFNFIAVVTLNLSGTSMSIRSQLRSSSHT